MNTNQSGAKLGSPPENYERYFVPAIGRPCAVDLVKLAALRPGERVLDAACGTGVVARLASEQVGENGTVTGVDINPGMLQVARATAPGGKTFEWHEASVEKMPLADGACDVAMCQMGLQFMEDKPGALKEIHRVLADGGRVLINVPGPMAPPFAILRDALRRHVRPAAAGFVQAVFALDDPKELERLMIEAGFEDVHVYSGNKTLTLPAAKDFLWQYVYSTPLAEFVAEADEDARERLEHDVVPQWKDFEKGGAMEYQQDMLVATGRK